MKTQVNGVSSAENSFSLLPKQHSRTELGTHPTIKRVVTSFSQALSRSARVKTSGTPIGQALSGMEHRAPYPGLGVANKRQPRNSSIKLSISWLVTSSGTTCCASGKPFRVPPVGPEPPHVRNWEPCMVLSFFATWLMASPVNNLPSQSDEGFPAPEDIFAAT